MKRKGTYVVSVFSDLVPEVAAGIIKTFLDQRSCFFPRCIVQETEMDQLDEISFVLPDCFLRVLDTGVAKSLYLFIELGEVRLLESRRAQRIGHCVQQSINFVFEVSRKSLNEVVALDLGLFECTKLRSSRRVSHFPFSSALLVLFLVQAQRCVWSGGEWRLFNEPMISSSLLSSRFCTDVHLSTQSIWLSSFTLLSDSFLFVVCCPRSSLRFFCHCSAS